MGKRIYFASAPMSRRAVLRLGAAASALAFLPRADARAGEEAGLCAVLITGVNGATPPDRLRAWLAPFAARGLPLGLVLPVLDGRDPGTQSPAQPLTADSPVTRLLNRAATERPHLFELVGWLPDPAESLTPFDQALRASALAAAMRAIFDPGLPGALPMSLALGRGETGEDGRDWPPPPLTLNGLRAGGFRSVALLAPPEQDEEPGAPGLAACPGPMRCILPGPMVALTDPAQVLSARIEAGRAGGPVPVHISVAGLGTRSAEDEARRAEEFAATLAEARVTGRVALGLPRDLPLAAPAPFERYLGLRIDAPALPDPEEMEMFEAFLHRLNDAGIPFTLATPEPAFAATRPGPCLIADGPGPLAAALDTLPGLRCAELPGANALSETLAGMGLSHVFDAGGGPGFAGMDAHGMLHLMPGLPPRDIYGLPAGHDAVISVRARDIATTAGQNITFNTLAALFARPGNRIVPLDFYARELLPPDPVFRLMQATRADRARTEPQPRTVTPAARAELVADARLAWSFFERMSDPVTGMARSTALVTADYETAFPVITLWDLASQILGTVAAWRIGVIETEDYRERIARILAHMPTAKIAGLSLPPSEFDVTAPSTGTADFNACDSGRMLSALAAVAADPVFADSVRDLVAGWDLEKVIDQGWLHSITRSSRSRFELNHCGHYTARAYKRFAMTLNSPYLTDPGQSPTHGHMNLLYRCARIGPITAEPLLLEGVEMGLSPPSTYLARMLFAAQLRAWEETGVIHCISEGPLDHAPWFTYQGFRIDAWDNPWTIQSLSSAPEFRTESFRRANFMVSSKAAFLWAALNPHPYSDRMLAYVRRFGRDNLHGFTTGIRAYSDEPAKGYSDANTNGVILQCIAHMLAG